MATAGHQGLSVRVSASRLLLLALAELEMAQSVLDYHHIRLERGPGVAQHHASNVGTVALECPASFYDHHSMQIKIEKWHTSRGVRVGRHDNIDGQHNAAV